MSFPEDIHLSLPSWVKELASETVCESSGFRLESAAERMAFVISLSRENTIRKTGGPFAAAIFEQESGKLISAGVNVVVPQHCSAAHAETMALMLAQQSLSSFDLGAEHLPAMQLVASSQPCIQCYGNTWWSGVTSLLIGARGDDVESITGFQEGPLPENWVDLLENRASPLAKVAVEQDILRADACDVLSLYRDSGGMIYNAGSS